MNLDTLRALVADRNVQAMLRVIREAESSQTDDAYFMRWGGGKVIDLSRHPGDAIDARDRTGRVIRSSATGAYQFLASTWNDVASVYGIPDFSPASQDAAAVALIHRAGALDDVQAGRLEAAIGKLNSVWAGLPGDRYGQGGITMQRARNAWAKYGGQLATEPARAENTPQPAVSAQPVDIQPGYDDFGQPVHQPEAPMPAPIAATVAAAIVPELLKLLPWHRAEARGVNTQAVQQAVIEAAKAAASRQTLEEAATVVTTDPAAQQRFVQQVAIKWQDIAPALQFEEQSRKEARAFADQVTSTGPEWRQIGFGVVISLLALTVVLGGGVMFYQFMHADNVSGEQKGMILGALLAAFSSVLSYFFGSSASSRAKDAALTDAARR
jgi:muramidase (phage lysozyme)/phage tail protein X